jgi:hypothetical protein
VKLRDLSLLLWANLGVVEEHTDEELERQLEHSAIIRDVKHHDLGRLQEIATRPERSFCRLDADFFMRVSIEEIIGHGLEQAVPDFLL